MAYEIDMHMLHLVHRYVPSTKKHTILFLNSEIKSLYCLNDVSFSSYFQFPELVYAKFSLHRYKYLILNQIYRGGIKLI